MSEVNLWEKVGNGCLKHAAKLLEKPELTDADIVHICDLTKNAIVVDTLNLLWSERSRSGAEALED